MNEIKSILLAMATMQQTLYMTIDAMMSEIAALRETAHGLDPTFLDVMEQRLSLERASGREAREAMHSALETTLQQIYKLPN